MNRNEKLLQETQQLFEHFFSQKLLADRKVQLEFLQQEFQQLKLIATSVRAYKGRRMEIYKKLLNYSFQIKIAVGFARPSFHRGRGVKKSSLLFRVQRQKTEKLIDFYEHLHSQLSQCEDSVVVRFLSRVSDITLREMRELLDEYKNMEEHHNSLHDYKKLLDIRRQLLEIKKTSL